MKYIIRCLPFLILTLLFSCNNFSSPGGGDNTEVLVKYPSPINLSNNVRALEEIAYDSTGTVQLSVDTVLLELKRVDSVNGISLISHYDSVDEFFTYELLFENKGLIIGYPQPNYGDGGIMVYGSFQKEDTSLYDNELFWICYPGYRYGDELTPLFSSVSETVLHETAVSIPNSDGYPKTTHCYRNHYDGDHTYSYYEIGDGLVAMLIYENGKRTFSYKKISGGK